VLSGPGWRARSRCCRSKKPQSASAPSKRQMEERTQREYYLNEADEGRSRRSSADGRRARGPKTGPGTSKRKIAQGTKAFPRKARGRKGAARAGKKLAPECRPMSPRKPPSPWRQNLISTGLACPISVETRKFPRSKKGPGGGRRPCSTNDPLWPRERSRDRNRPSISPGASRPRAQQADRPDPLPGFRPLPGVWARNPSLGQRSIAREPTGREEFRPPLVRSAVRCGE